METLEQLKEKFNKLDKERGILFKKILELENQETLKEFTVGNCYLDIWNNHFAKIIAIDSDEFCSIIIDENSIKRDWFTVEDIKNWKKITSHQFKDIYLATMKDIRDPDLEETESNFNMVYNSIINSVKKKSNMEKEIDIAKILKNATIGTKLYSPLFGDVFLKYIGEMFITVRHHGTTANFYHNGRLYDYEGTELMLFPSREMRDWSKFNWKKGDVLVSNDGGTEVIFDKWYDDTYTNFYSKHYLNSEDENNIKYNEAFLCTTERYSLENKDAAQTYINTIEEKLGGKLNRETLEVEKFQPEFKDGDIVTCKMTHGSSSIILVKRISSRKVYFHAYMINGEVHTQETEKDFYGYVDGVKIATDSEKQQLFEALAKKGKTWDAEKKAIVNLPKKCEFRAFDKVLVRDSNDYKWKAGFFSHYSEGLNYPFICVGGGYGQCIPYNEDTKHLLGTTDEWKGGEG